MKHRKETVQKKDYGSEKEQAEAEVEALKSRISDLEEALRIERLRNQLNEKSLI